jgi:uncharacterized membrane protein SpoIIM required for sporulation
MLEMLINPKKAERHPWEMFFVGAFYSSLSVLLVNWIFSKDPVLSKSAGILVVTFTVMFSIPFMYYIIKLEEKRAGKDESSFNVLKEHKRALMAFMWLFMGFVIGYSFWYMVLADTNSFTSQIETYCLINRPGNIERCAEQYGIKDVQATAFATNKERLFLIFTNNLYVLIFTLIFSLLFGAGVIFILAWNASVIAAAMGIFVDSSIKSIPIALFRYMIHGIPEIGSYFVAALAGGIISVAVISHEINTPKFWRILQDTLNLIILAVVVLLISALIEVFITPLFF